MALSEVYPNPIEDSKIEFEIYTSEAGRYEVKIYTMLGEEKYASIYDLPEGSNIMSIETGAIKGLASGTYILQVSNGREVLRRQFVVIR